MRWKRWWRRRWRRWWKEARKVGKEKGKEGREGRVVEVRRRLGSVVTGGGASVLRDSTLTISFSWIKAGYIYHCDSIIFMCQVR